MRNDGAMTTREPGERSCAACGHRAVGNGWRDTTVLHCDHRGFSRVAFRCERLRCVGCGRSEKGQSSTIRDGFLISIGAADRLLDIAVDEGITAATRGAAIGTSTMMRLLADEATRIIRTTQCPTELGLASAGAGRILAFDRSTDRAAACFATGDPALARWIADGSCKAIFPRAELFGVARSMGATATIHLDEDATTRLLAPAVRRSARRMARIAKLDDEGATLLTALDDNSRREGLTGTSRSFFSRVDLLRSALLASEPQDVDRRTDSWIASLDRTWTEVFEPVASMLTAYRGILMTHRLCAVAAMPDLSSSLRHRHPTLVTVAIDRMTEADDADPFALPT